MPRAVVPAASGRARTVVPAVAADGSGRVLSLLPDGLGVVALFHGLGEDLRGRLGPDEGLPRPRALRRRARV
jgi:hypothetical protein